MYYKHLLKSLCLYYLSLLYLSIYLNTCKSRRDQLFLVLNTNYEIQASVEIIMSLLFKPPKFIQLYTIYTCKSRRDQLFLILNTNYEIQASVEIIMSLLFKPPKFYLFTCTSRRDQNKYKTLPSLMLSLMKLFFRCSLRERYTSAAQEAGQCAGQAVRQAAGLPRPCCRPQVHRQSTL